MIPAPSLRDATRTGKSKVKSQKSKVMVEKEFRSGAGDAPPPVRIKNGFSAHPIRLDNLFGGVP